MTAGEQKQIKDAINIMILCGMTFKENTDIESDLIKYEPDISKVLRFGNVSFASRLSNNQKVILKMEYDKLKSLKNLNKTDENNKRLLEDKKKENNINVIMNTMAMGKKRKMGQFLSPEYKFIYKYNEGVTNCVRRSLNVNYFFEGNKQKQYNQRFSYKIQIIYSLSNIHLYLFEKCSLFDFVLTCCF